MPFTTAQFTSGATYALQTFDKKDPIDQINQTHRALDWLVKNKKPSMFGNGAYREPLYYTNNSNYQQYFGADQVTYNERDPAMWTNYPWYNVHDGFWFDEDTLQAAGITITEDSSAVPTASEKEVLIDRLGIAFRATKNSLQDGMALDLYRDGTQSTKACPGFESVIDWTPAVGTSGGIDGGTYTWWRNNANIGATAANVITDSETLWKNCMRYGGKMPTAIFCGLAWQDNFRTYANQMVNRQLNDGGNAKGGVSIDPATNDLFFHGVPVIWDPTLEELDTLLSTTTRTKTAYFVNADSLSLRPVKGAWMVDRKPERLPDRYVYYWARTAKFSLTSNQRNALGVHQLS